MTPGKLYRLKRPLILWTQNSVAQNRGTCHVEPGDIVMCVVKNKSAGIFRGQSVYQHKVLVQEGRVYNLPSLTASEQDIYFELAIGKQQQQ